jgi:D-cysteine desulfhydrase
MHTIKPNKYSAFLRDKISPYQKLSLGIFPTPLKKITSSHNTSFWVKDEGKSHHYYGGNKIRKLEYFFAWALEKNIKHLVVWGGKNSHTVEAVVLIAPQYNFKITAIIYQSNYQKTTKKADDILSFNQIKIKHARTFFSAFLLAKITSRLPESIYIPLGATTAYSTLGHIAAACEFVEQWRQSNKQWPGAIYFALGSGGSVAGLAIGFALMKLPVKINAVQTVNTSIINHRKLKNQIKTTLKLLGLNSRLASSIIKKHIHIDQRFMGKGYGDITESSVKAVAMARNFGLNLEPVYTGKVMAAVLQDINDGPSSDIIYWHSHSNIISRRLSENRASAENA